VEESSGEEIVIGYVVLSTRGWDALRGGENADAKKLLVRRVCESIAEVLDGWCC
jgi:hypothetical protein